MTPQPNPAAGIVTPALREDLQLLGASHDGDDDVRLVYDPVAHRYHQVDDQAFAILGLWRGGLPLDQFAPLLGERLGVEVTVDDLAQLSVTFDQAGLFSEPLRGWRAVHHDQQDRRQGPFSWLLHNYLFVRIPLVRPDAFLSRTLPFARLLASRPVLWLLALMGFVGIYLTSRQWDAFVHTFSYFFSLEGAAGFLAALCVVKLFHELGHAYMARHFGCRVPTMGIAFMVLAPFLYTDVTDSWRLPSRRQRLLITAAGMMTELALAAVATFLWALLPDGTAKSVCFFVATTSLVMSLAINLSPLMRFDGYYLLSDGWRIPNLQSRAFALLCWWLRETLFGLRAPCPEDWPRRRRLAVIVYAIAVCVYRLFLFIGIALLVYHMTFKILGILLFAVEIVWFVARPIAGEMMVWWRLRRQITQRRRYRVSLAGAVAVALVALVPWPHRVEIPAVLEPVAVQRLAAPVAAQVTRVAVKAGDRVEPGDVILTLASPKLASEIGATGTKLDLARLRRDRRIADQQDRDATITLDQEIASLKERAAGLERLAAELTIAASVSGIVQDLSPDLHAGRWVARAEELGIVVAAGGHQVRGYLAEEMISAVTLGAEGRFIPDEPLSSRLSVHLAAIGESAVAALDLPYLSSTHGGTVAVTEDREKGGLPVEAQYQVVLTIDTHPPPSLPVLRGIVQIDARPESVVIRIGRRALAVLIRESGF